MVNGLMVFIVIFFAPNTIFIVTSRVFDRIYCHIAGLRPHLLPLRWSATAFIAASRVCDRIYCHFAGLRPHLLPLRWSATARRAMGLFQETEIRFLALFPENLLQDIRKVFFVGF